MSASTTERMRALFRSIPPTLVLQNQSRRNRSEQSPHALGSGGTHSALCIAIPTGIYGFGVSSPGPATEQPSRIGLWTPTRSLRLEETPCQEHRPADRADT